VIDRLARLVAAGVIKRLGCVVRHRFFGYDANAMVVWDVPDEMTDAVAGHFAANPGVTLCYRRPRRPPHWPYNLFCMVHAKAREQALATVAELNAAAGTARLDQAVLFSTRCFKQRGAVFSAREPEVQ
jgi:DNA-binding Lrp family transcriptional regulator